MQIKRMEEYHLENIIKIDQLAFERVEPRSLENLYGLRSLDPEGCFILTEGDEIIGYSFSKTMGSEGYLGPVGIHPSYQENGMGQKIIQPSMEYLKSRCQVIGLEVRPEAGENLGLYHKLGIHSTFPSLIMEVPDKIEVKLEGPNDYGVEPYSKMSQTRKEVFLEKIDLWTQQELMGISYRDDLELTHAGGGQIIIVSQGEEPMGVLSSYQGVFIHLWGVMKPRPCQKDVLNLSLNSFCEFNGREKLLLEVNSRYNKLIDFLLEEDFRIQKSINRMLLKNFGGQHLNKSPNFVMRAWHA